VQHLFGIPVGIFAAVLAIVVVVAFATIAVLAVRNRVFFRLGVRNIARRRGRSTLIVGGLMLATAIIASSLVTGDTMGHTIRASVLTSLGTTDERIGVRGAEVDESLGIRATARTGYFDAGKFDLVRRALAGSPLVDGIAPAVVETVAVQDGRSRQTEPRVGLFGSDPAHMAGFGSIRGPNGEVSLADLAPGEVYATRQAVEAFGARRGDPLMVFGGAEPTTVRVRDVVRFDGAGIDGAAVLAPLGLAQRIVGQPDRIKYVLVSNRGGEVSGATHTDAVLALTRPVAFRLGLDVKAVKQDGLRAADAGGNAFMSLFGTFGTFAIAAGIMLIFLIFVMLAAERRTEMGIARAVGTQRRHLVQTFVYEGAVYDVIAAAVGAFIGLGVAYLMVQIVAVAFASEGFEIRRAFRYQSLLLAWGMGVVLTLAVVTASAWRVSVLDIVTAIRNLPSPVKRRARRTNWLRGLAGVALGAAFLAAGLAAEQAMPVLLGLSVIVLGLVPVARALGVPDRVAYTGGGAALVGWWLLPLTTFERLFGTLRWDFSVWIVAGLMIVLGGTWTVMYNADVVLGVVTRVLGRIRSIAPVVRMSVAYPLRNRLRTSMTLAMFTLVVFTLVTGTVISGSFISSFDDVKRFSGGFQVSAMVSPVRPIHDMAAAIRTSPRLHAADFTSVGGQSLVPAEVRQVGTERGPADYPVRGLDRTFLDHTTFGFQAYARGYHSPQQVWRALRDHPNLAVIDGIVAPRRSHFDFGARPDLSVTGFAVEDKVFDPVRLSVRDPESGTTIGLTVIAVLEDNAPFAMAGVTTSQATLAPLGDRAAPTTFWIGLAPGVDADATADRLESAFLSYGLQADSLRHLLRQAVGASWTFNRLVEGFVGLGLVVGVVALGVVSARAVVERRQHIGVLRAIGFQPSAVRLGFLAEASFVAVTAILAGSAFGLAVGYNVVSYLGRQQHVAFVVPWASLAVVFGAVLVAALGSALLPALRASRVYPAEALRYE
jgi:putative ABC transport system permease protein